MNSTGDIRSTCKPFLRWIGGKSRLIRWLSKFVPTGLDGHTYWEPFLGAGSLFFAIEPKKAVLSDINSDLIMCFNAVMERPDLVSRYLREHRNSLSKDYYYEIRSKYNISKDTFAKAAMFIFLNQTCFNGIWRVNSAGKFNVPVGCINSPALPSRRDLLKLSGILVKTELKVGDFREVLKDTKENDFIYMDPPYARLNSASYFTHYNKDRFDDDDQIAVADTLIELDKKGCKVLISNVDTEFIRSLYNGFNITEQDVTRWVRADGKRYQVSELLVYNYELDK